MQIKRGDLAHQPFDATRGIGRLTRAQTVAYESQVCVKLLPRAIHL